jgi:hypothetical protein
MEDSELNDTNALVGAVGGAENELQNSESSEGSSSDLYVYVRRYMMSSCNKCTHHVICMCELRREKVLVFCQSPTSIDVIEEFLLAEHTKNETNWTSSAITDVRSFTSPKQRLKHTCHVHSD